VKILLKAAKIIDSKSDYHQLTKDILIENGIITAIEDHIDSPGSKKIALEELHVSPGWFDTSVSLGEPGLEDRETIANGLEVAAKSGFTSVAVNPNSKPLADNKSVVEFIVSKGRESMVDVWPIGNLTLHAEGKELAELYDMSNSGAIAFGDYNKPISNSNLLKIALLYAQNFDGLIMSFPQDANIAGSGFVHEGIQSTHLGLRSVPALAEELQIIRDLYILDYTGGRLHIPTISTEKSVKLIRDAKKQGLQVTCSVAAHNLVLDDSCLDGFDADYKVNPPLRSKKDIKALIKGLEDGTIDIITSDHNPIDIENKKLEIQNAMYGTIGLESFFGSLNGILDLDLLIKAISSNPRKVFNRPEVKIALDEKACLSLFNPHKTYVFDADRIRSKSKNAIFKNYKMKGLAYGIINKGTLVLV